MQLLHYMNATVTLHECSSNFMIDHCDQWHLIIEDGLENAPPWLTLARSGVGWLKYTFNLGCSLPIVLRITTQLWENSESLISYESTKVEGS